MFSLPEFFTAETAFKCNNTGGSAFYILPINFNVFKS